MEAGASGLWFNYSEANAIRQAEIFKSLFGDDVFTKFGEWYQKQR